MKGVKIWILVGQDADDVLCCLAKVGGFGYPGEVKVIQEEIYCVHVPGGCY